MEKKIKIIKCVKEKQIIALLSRLAVVRIVCLVRWPKRQQRDAALMLPREISYCTVEKLKLTLKAILSNLYSCLILHPMTFPISIFHFATSSIVCLTLLLSISIQLKFRWPNVLCQTQPVNLVEAELYLRKWVNQIIGKTIFGFSSD